jgi:predicted membrane protein
MKAGCIFSGFFWGFFLILLGAAVILKAVFHIEVPVFKIFLGLLIIALGLRMLLGGFCRPKSSIVFDEGTVRVHKSQKEYNIIFGKGSVDLQNLVPDEKTIRAEINTIFGAADVFIDPQIPARIRVNTAFGTVRLPDAQNAAFGSYIYASKNYVKNQPHLEINITAIFGSAEIVQKNPDTKPE